MVVVWIGTLLKRLWWSPQRRQSSSSLLLVQHQHYMWHWVPIHLTCKLLDIIQEFGTNIPVVTVTKTGLTAWFFFQVFQRSHVYYVFEYTVLYSPVRRACTLPMCSYETLVPLPYQQFHCMYQRGCKLIQSNTITSVVLYKLTCIKKDGYLVWLCLIQE